MVTAIWISLGFSFNPSEVRYRRSDPARQVERTSFTVVPGKEKHQEHS